MTEDSKGGVGFRQLCEICARHGRQSRIRVFQINFEEAVRICENEKCTYPFGLSASFSPLLDRKFSDMSLGQQRKNSKGKNTASKKPQTQPLSNSAVNIKLLKMCTPPVVHTNPSNNTQPYIPGQVSQLSLLKMPNSAVAASYQSTAKSSNSNCQTASAFQSISNTSENASVDKPVPDSVQQSLAQVKELTGNLQDDKTKNKQVCMSPKKSDNTKEGVNNVRRSTECGKLRLQTLLYHRFPQWQNKDALCWLDVIMCLLSHSRTVKQFVSSNVCPKQSVLVTLLKAYAQATMLVNKISKQSQKANCKLSAKNGSFDSLQGKSSKMGGSEICSRSPPDVISQLPPAKRVIMQTGAGLRMANAVPRFVITNSRESPSAECPDASAILNNVREKIWHSLQPRLRCEKGKKDSPVFAFPLLARESPAVEKLFRMKYRFELECEVCGYRQVDTDEKVLPTFPNVMSPLNMQEPTFVRSCFKCSAPGQKRKMQFESLPEIVLLHFVEGLPHSDLAQLDFSYHGDTYTVTGIVQYKNSPDHFVAWIRDPYDNLWMECDDLNTSLCQFQPDSPNIPSSEIHIVMWERACAKFKKPKTLDARPESRFAEFGLSSCPASRSVSVQGEQTFIRNLTQKNASSHISAINRKNGQSDNIPFSVSNKKSELTGERKETQTHGNDQVPIIVPGHSMPSGNSNECKLNNKGPNGPLGSEDRNSQNVTTSSDKVDVKNSNPQTKGENESIVGGLMGPEGASQNEGPDKKTLNLESLQKLVFNSTGEREKNKVTIIVQGGVGGNISSDTLAMVAKAIQSQQPDAIVTLAAKPSVDGVTVQRDIQAEEKPPHISESKGKEDTPTLPKMCRLPRHSMPNRTPSQITVPIVSKASSPFNFGRPKTSKQQKSSKELETRISKIQHNLTLLRERNKKNKTLPPSIVKSPWPAMDGALDNSVHSAARSGNNCRLSSSSRLMNSVATVVGTQANSPIIFQPKFQESRVGSESKSQVNGGSSYLGALKPYLQNVLKRGTQINIGKSLQAFEGYKPRGIVKNLSTTEDQSLDEFKTPSSENNLPPKSEKELSATISSKRKSKQEIVSSKRTKISGSAASTDSSTKSLPVSCGSTNPSVDKDPVSHATSDDKKCQVLQNLYDALNLPFPDTAQTLSPVKDAHRLSHGQESSGLGNVSKNENYTFDTEMLDVCLSSTDTIDKLEPSDEFVNALDDLLAEL